MLTQAPFIQARNFTKSAHRSILAVCIHTMEAPEGPKTAENVANWFATQPVQGQLVNGKPWRGTSAHWNVDADSIVQSVREQDIAWHAGPVNGWSIGVEHAGYARQSASEWQDEYSTNMLIRSARLVAEICFRWDIPVMRVTANDLKLGQQCGIFGHCDVTKAFAFGDHTDPGAFFPWDTFLTRVSENIKNMSRYPLVGTVTSNRLNVRSAPTTESAILGTLSRGSRVTIVGVVDTYWFKIENGGYVHADYIDTDA